MQTLRHAFRSQPQLAILLLLIAIASLSFDKFISPLNLSALGFQPALIGFLVLGQFLVVLTRGIDLSQGSIVAVAGMAAAVAANQFGAVPGAAAGIAAGILIGAVNGGIVAWTRIPPFVVTLGMMGIARGIALTVTESAPIKLTDKALITIAWTKLLAVPVASWTLLVVSVLLAIFLSRHIFGRHFYAVGGHEEHARLSGVNSRGVKVLAYALSGGFCGIAAVFLTARLGTGHPLSGNAWELESIAAAIIGGAGLLGGTGRVLGVICGVFILGVVDSMINLAGISPYLQGTLKGCIILVAVILSARTFSTGAPPRPLAKT